MVPLSISLLLLVFLPEAQAFAQSSASNAANSRDHVVRSSGKNDRLYFGVFGTTTTSLCVSPIPSGDRPPPRRTLKKRKNKRRQRQRMTQVSHEIRGLNRHKTARGGVDGDHDDIEIRPVRRQDAIKAGLDYWIDDSDYEKERRRLRNRKAMEVGAISKEKLIEEVVAPYKQNWIGIISVSIVALSAIGTTFPELLQLPVIPIPDL